MSVLGIPTGTFILIFGWIPFWWLVAGAALYLMRQHDEQNDERVPVGETDG